MSTDSKNITIQTPEDAKVGRRIMKTTITTTSGTHVYLGASKIYFLQETYRSRRGKLHFDVSSHIVIKADRRLRGTAKRFKKWSSDPHLYTIADWQNSEKEMVRIGRMRLLKRRTTPEGQAHVPVAMPYQFPKDLTAQVLIDIISDQNVCITGRQGTGKCLGKDTPVLMYNGSIQKVQDICKGDQIMGPDSTPRKVINTASGVDDLYEVRPVKGSPWVCNSKHILSLQNSTGNIIDVPILDYIKKRKENKLQRYHQFRVPVSFPEQQLPMDPYLMGLWLGDGSRNTSHLTINTKDTEILDWLMAYQGVGLKSVVRSDYPSFSNCCRITIKSKRDWSIKTGKNRGRAYYRTMFDQALDADGGKIIPSNYLINSNENQLRLLAGLMDTDGYFQDGGYEITTKFEPLSKQILFLSRSLGFAAYSKVKIGKIKKLNFEGTYYRIFISGDLSMLPVLLPRKKAPVRKQVKSVLRTSITIHPLGRGDYFGFEIDEDKRFVLGDFTVTHNTTLIQQIAARINVPCFRIQTSSGVTPESFVGGYVPGPDKTIVWADGYLPKAARNGWWAILDEWDFAPAHIRTLANPALETQNRQVILTDKDGGETLSRHDNSLHKDFRVFSTGNTMGSMADEADFFGGYADPNAAQLSRWNVYHIDFLEKKELARVIKSRTPELTGRKIAQIVKVADTINEAKIAGAWFSTRVALAVANKMKYGASLLLALEPTFLNHHDSGTRRRAMQAITDGNINL